MTPFTVVIGPVLPLSALASSPRMITASTMKSPISDLPGVITSGKWVEEAMKNTIGIEKRTLVREATVERAPRAAAAGFAGLPAAVSTAFWITTFCAGQITNQTLNHM